MSIEEQLERFKQQVEEKDSTIADLNKKLRLGEFRLKKQANEMSLQLEKENIKLQESEDRSRSLQDLVKQLQEKAVEQDKLILKLREKSQDQSESSEEENEEVKKVKIKKFMPRESMILRAGNDLSQFPSYTELINLIQQQTGDNSQMQDEMKKLQGEAMNVVQELQNHINGLTQELNESNQKIVEQSNKKQRQSVGNVDMARELKNLQEEYENHLKRTDIEKNNLNQSIIHLSAKIDEMKYRMDSNDVEDRLKDEFSQKRLQDEEDFSRQKSLLFMQMESNEDKIRQYEQTLSDIDEKQRVQIEVLLKNHGIQIEEKNQEIKYTKLQLEKEQKQHKETVTKQANDVKQQHEKNIHDLKYEISSLQLNIDSLNKKLQRLESDRDRKDVWLEEYKQSDISIKQELHNKNEKINQLLEYYEAKIEEMTLQHKSTLKEHEDEVLLLQQQYTNGINQKSAENEANQIIEQLNSKLEKHSATIEEKEKIILHLEKEIIDQGSQHNLAIEMKDKALDEAEKYANDQEKQNVLNSLQIDEKCVLISKLEDDNNESQVKIALLEKQMIDQVSQHNQAIEMKDKQNALQIDEKCVLISKLEDDNNESQAKIALLNLKLKQQGQQQREEQHERRQLEIQLEDRHMQLVERDMIIAQLGTNYIDLQEEFHQHSLILESKRQTISDLEQTIKSQKEQITRLQANQSIQKLKPNQELQLKLNQELLELQQIIYKLNERERELLIEMEKCNEARRSERAELMIRIVELESAIALLREELMVEREDRQYAEEIAAKESILRAQMAMDFDIQYRELRKRIQK